MKIKSLNFNLNLFELYFLKGGLGGLTGYYSFIQTGIYANGTPKNIRINGNSGTKGSDARTCKTHAKQVKADSLQHVYLVPMFTINTGYSSFNIDDPYCPANYVTTLEAIEPQNSIKQLNASFAVDEYNKILLQNMENPVLSSTLQKAFDAINSHSN